MANGKDVPTDDQDGHNPIEDSTLSRRRLLQVAGTGLVGSGFLIGTGSAADSPDRLEIVAHHDSEVEYTFECGGTIERVSTNSLVSTETDEDTVTENDDGTWTATGVTADGYGDAFELGGDVFAFEPTDGEYSLYLNGDRIAHGDLVQPRVDREHSYAFEGTGDEWADYYLEVEDNADMVASTLDGAVIEDEFHWISADGTKAAGRVDPGERHAYEFDNLVLDVTIEGQADAFVDGGPSDLSYYPQPGATGDDWKSGFPWQEVEVDREHSYAFEGTGDEWADYYLEVEDNADMVASTLDGAVIEDEFHWVSDDGTKAAGRVDPGERHAYEFDNLVLDVTIEGQADAFVDGSPSDLSYYPQPGATGDDWKGGFPWQDEEDGSTEPAGEGVVGGGPGYEHVVPESAADAVVRTRSDLENALSAASSGDVVYVPGDVSIDLGDRAYNVPDGVTLASDRGIDGSAGAVLSTDYEVGELIRVHGDGRLTGVQVKGPHPGDDWGGSSSAGGAETLGAGEIDNCDVWGFSHHGIQADSGDGAHIHHNVIRENNTSGLGYGVAASSGTPVIEYNYFNYNRHSVATGGNNPGYVLRYNHFGPKEVMHNIDAHRPAGERYEIHNNVVETVRREWDDNLNHSVNIRGVPDDRATIRDNWFFNDNAPDPDGSPDAGGQTIVQEHVSDWRNVSFSGNAYGEGASVSYGDVIPGYDGWRS